MKVTPARTHLFRYLLPLVLLLPATLGMVDVGSKLPSFSLEDQHKKKWKRKDYEGKVALYIICDRDAYDYVANWTDELVPKYKKKINFVPVADVTTVPDLLKGYIRGRFKDEFTYPVLMDWDGVLVTALDRKAGYPTLVITDDKGVVKYRSWGKGTDSQVKRLAKKLKEVTEGEET